MLCKGEKIQQGRDRGPGIKEWDRWWLSYEAGDQKGFQGRKHLNKDLEVRELAKHVAGRGALEAEGMATAKKLKAGMCSVCSRNQKEAGVMEAE